MRWAWGERWLSLVMGLLLVACSGLAGPGTTATPVQAPRAAPAMGGALTIFAAASLRDAFAELGQTVEAANPGTRLTFNVAGSAALRAQLREGARADLLATADEPTMRAAQQDGTIIGEPRVFVQNRLVAIVAAQKADEVAELRDLARPGLKLVLAQAAVPIGAYARQSLTRLSQETPYGADFATRVLANVVSDESNVRQVVAKVQLGEADAGIVYASDVTPAVRGQVTVLDIPDRFNVVAAYPIAIVRGAANPDGAQAFIDYLLSPAGQATMQRWGFIPVGPTGATRMSGEG